ncbi:hypothetical protein YC2023_028704 [Brassica napus]
MFHYLSSDNNMERASGFGEITKRVDGRECSNWRRDGPNSKVKQYTEFCKMLGVTPDQEKEEACDMGRTCKDEKQENSPTKSPTHIQYIVVIQAQNEVERETLSFSSKFYLKMG